MGGRALWYIPTARTLPVVWDCINRTDYVDKLIVKNFQKDTADEIAMQFFFRREEYDYLIISTDDVVGAPHQVKLLLEDEEENGFPIVSGWCNHINQWASLRVEPLDSELLVQALEEPFPGIGTVDYHFPGINEVVAGVLGYPFFTVWFTGMPLTLIRRETLREVPFKAFRFLQDKHCVTPMAKKRGRGMMQDLQWAIDCAKKGVPIVTDARIFLLHVFGTREALKVGENPSVGLSAAKDSDVSKEEKDEIYALLDEIVEKAWREI